MIVRKFRVSDARAVESVVFKTFGRFNRGEGTRAAVSRYVNRFSPSVDIGVLRKNFARDTIHFVAVDKGVVVGMIRGVSDRIVNLYVLGEYQGRGVGKKLLLMFEKESRVQGSRFIRTRASLFATNFYSFFGFKKTTGIRVSRGLKFQPMIKRF